MRRSRLEIYLSVLRVIQANRVLKPTQILYRANLSWGLLQRILDSLVRNGLISVRDVGNGRKMYCLTEKGLGVYRVLEEAYAIIELLDGGGRGASTVFSFIMEKKEGVSG